MLDEIQDIPRDVKESLPQEMWGAYVVAFNNAWKNYDAGKCTPESRDEFAHRIALSYALWPRTPNRVRFHR